MTRSRRATERPRRPPVPLIARQQTAAAPIAAAEEAYVIEEMTTRHEVQEDGSGRRRLRAKVRIKSPAGVTQ